MAHASVRDQEYDPTWLISEDANSDPTIEYHLSSFELQAAYNTARNIEISSDQISFSNFSTCIEGNVATASIVEEYSYYLDEGFDDDYNYRMREYTFSLVLDESNDWRITRVVTNDPWETDDFIYRAIDVDTTVQAMMVPVYDVATEVWNERPMDMESESLSTDSFAPLNLYAYNPSKAIAYAQQWYSANSRETANSVFGYSTNNCQNFASQCIWAGLCSGTVLPNTSTAWPAISTSLVGSNAPNVWCRNQCSTYYSAYYYNWAWDNVGGFTKLIETSSIGRIGPVGTVRNGLSYAEAGDEIAYANLGTPSSSNLNHAMFVTEVTGTSGSRGVENIKIAANNSSTNSAYQTLNSYIDYPASRFLTIHITYIAGEAGGDPIM